jgi:hypothetical protein
MIPERKPSSDGDSFDALLPTQYYDLLRRRTILEGERKLMFAVLEDAIQCYLKNMKGRTERQRSLFAEVQRWFDGAEGAKGGSVFSFENVCRELGIDHVRLRKRLDPSRLSDLPATRNRRVTPTRPLSSTIGSSRSTPTMRAVRGDSIESFA